MSGNGQNDGGRSPWRPRGLGDEEIIGYEEKPTGIVVERKLLVDKGETGKE
ncbi:MAG: hypothetical protein KJ002_12815 [Candidatus Dadabacteria bacterium]|nr:hypothetical protein [Candidatus Dadabacteria bacterium]